MAVRGAGAIEGLPERSRSCVVMAGSGVGETSLGSLVLYQLFDGDSLVVGQQLRGEVEK